MGIEFSNVDGGANTFDGGVKIGSMISIVVDTFVRTSRDTSGVVEDLLVYVSNGYLQINSNHVGNKIVEPFGFIEVSQKNAFFVMHIKLDTLYPWGCERKPHNHTLKDGATLGVSQRGVGMGSHCN